MASIDYMKVIDIITKLFDASRPLDLDARHEKSDIFDVRSQRSDGSGLEYRIVLGKFDIQIIIGKKYFPENGFDKWLPRFEFEMEQAFLSNISLKIEDEPEQYRIKIVH